jgi:hypothetical protein
LRKLPQNSKSLPSHKRGEIVAALLALRIVNPSKCANCLSLFDINTRGGRLPKLMQWFDSYSQGQSIKNNRDWTDYTDRFQAFLKALLTGEIPTDGANGFDDEEFTKILADNLANEAKIKVMFNDRTRKPTGWKANRDYLPDR